MPNDMAHERMRFATMTQRQLQTRLNKITDRIKIRNFIQLCREYHYDRLEALAVDRLHRLIGDYDLVPPVHTSVTTSFESTTTTTMPEEMINDHPEEMRCRWCNALMTGKGAYAFYDAKERVIHRFHCLECLEKFKMDLKETKKREGVRVINIRKEG